ncbi:MAG: CPBP family intramembrane metalloprotease [Acidobacteriota bacterium]|nr:MAG: CPBP family intramembrane metalloprotease [Acidobacteriota bacterium]
MLIRHVNQYPGRHDLMVVGVLAAAAFVALYFPNRDDMTGAIVGAALASCGSAMGFAAVARVRPLPKRSLRERARFMVLSLLTGMALGLANLTANYTVASLDSRTYVRMSEMYARASPWSGVFANPLLEEIGFRLFLMGGIAWLLSRSTDDLRRVFLIALVLSAAVFGPIHLLRPPAGLLDATVVVLKAGVAGLVLGWVFWRWGLPYSVICHGTTNGIHLLAVRLFF